MRFVSLILPLAFALTLALSKVPTLTLISSNISQIVLKVSSPLPLNSYRLHMKDDAGDELLSNTIHNDTPIIIEQFKGYPLRLTRYEIRVIDMNNNFSPSILEINLELPMSLFTSTLRYNPKNMTELVLETKTETGSLKTTGGAAVYMSVANSCSKSRITSLNFLKENLKNGSLRRMRDLGNGFYIGNYQARIQECNTLSLVLVDWAIDVFEDDDAQIDLDYCFEHPQGNIQYVVVEVNQPSELVYLDLSKVLSPTISSKDIVSKKETQIPWSSSRTNGTSSEISACQFDCQRKNSSFHCTNIESAKKDSFEDIFLETNCLDNYTISFGCIGNCHHPSSGRDQRNLDSRLNAEEHIRRSYSSLDSAHPRRLACNAGSFGSDNNCSPCPAGTKGADGSSCQQCEQGTYSLGGSSSCTPCQVGSYSNLPGVTSCMSCPGGSYTTLPGQIACLLCKGGKYNSGGSAPCQACPNGTYSHEGSSSCIPCQQGTYNPITGQSACTGCGVGKYGTAIGATNSTVCLPCPVATYNSILVEFNCPLCPAGTFNNQQGQSDCISCPAGTSSGRGQTECTPCPVGTFSGERSSSCTDCWPGSYNPSTGQSTCSLCSSGTYNPKSGSKSYDDCLPCSIGTANPSTGASLSTACMDCVPGFYNDLQGQNECFPCPKGRYNTRFGSTDLERDCIKCPLMMYNDQVGQTQCKDCDVRAYSAALGAEECKPCHGLCRTCYGGTNNDCNFCREEVLDLKPFKGNTCSCQLRFFYDSTQTDPANFCQPCHNFCTQCDISSTYCSSCIDNPGITLVSNRCLCDVPGYYFDYDEVTRKSSCLKCHPLCLECDGPSSSDCKSCGGRSGSILLAPKTCSCPPNQYYDISAELCMPCNSACDSCFGPSNKECISCKFPDSFGFFFEPNRCVKSCYELEGYYRLGIYYCHNDCKNCLGPGNSSCTFCSDPKRLLYQNSCLDTCPEHFAAVSGICNECHSSCKNCFKMGKAGCSSCEPGKFLFNGQCVITCPEKTYPFMSGIQAVCTFCVSPCSTCLNSSTCIQCLKGFYMSEGSCIDGSLCPNGTFPDDVSLTCKKCPTACEYCYGPTSMDCKTCNYLKGYGWNSGACSPLVCPDGTYLSVDIDKQEAICAKCHPYCKTCISESSSDCLECNKGLLRTLTSTNYTVSCKECPKGYTITPEGGCQEICGDGLNLGTVECDDGNINEGDGCNSECEVEFGYRCFTNANAPDTCVSVLLPKATMKLMKGNVLVITFDKNVVSKSSFEKLAGNMKVNLIGVGKDCDFTWNLNDDFEVNKNLNKLTIKTFPACTLQNSAQVFTVEFSDYSQIVDIFDNPLAPEVLKANSKTFIYISNTEAATLDGIGTAFNSLSTSSFVVMLGFSLFQSTVMGSFWSFVDLTQLISFMPLLNCSIPYNFQKFTSEYLMVKQVTIPFDMLPDFKYNPLNYFKVFLTKAFNNKLFMAGYESLTFMENFSNEIITWLAMVLLYTLLRLLRNVNFRLRRKYINGWIKQYKYNAIIRMFMEGYVNMTFCATLDLWNSDIKTFPGLISKTTAAIVMFLAIGFVFISFILVENDEAKLKSRFFSSTFGTIIEGIKVKNGCLYYYPLFLLRRLLYSIIMVALYDRPIFQISVLLVACILPMFAYLVRYCPFKSALDNGLSIFNEVILLICFGSILMMNLVDIPDTITQIWGWGFIALALLSLCIVWFQTFPSMAKNLFYALRNYFVSKTKMIEKLCKENDEPKKIENNNGATEVVVESI